MTRRSRYQAAEETYGHPLQYAFVNGLSYPRSPIALETGELDDDRVLAAMRDHQIKTFGLLDNPRALRKLEHLHGYRSEIWLDRYNRCPTCEQWSPCDVRKTETALLAGLVAP